MRYGRRGSADPVSADDQEAVTSVTFSGPRPMEQSIPQGALRDLVGAARAGDGAATDQLMAGVHQIAVRYARARLGTLPGAREAAQDVAQEVCVAVLTSLSRYTDRGLPFEAFGYRIAANKVADAQRGTLRGAVPTDDVPDQVDSAAGPEEHALRSDQARAVWELMDRLSPQHREIVTLRVAVGLSADETAEALGMTPGAVRVAQHRALGRLRSMLAEGSELA